MVEYSLLISHVSPQVELEIVSVNLYLLQTVPRERPQSNTLQQRLSTHSLFKQGKARNDQSFSLQQLQEWSMQIRRNVMQVMPDWGLQIIEFYSSKFLVLHVISVLYDHKKLEYIIFLSKINLVFLILLTDKLSADWCCRVDYWLFFYSWLLNCCYFKRQYRI